MRGSGVHLPIMVREVLEHLRPRAGELAIDCTLGAGGHAEALLAHLAPGGRLVGLEVDPIEGPRTTDRLRAAGYGADHFTGYPANFSALPRICAAECPRGADLILADLGVSAMQLDTPERGFSYKSVGPLDMRMDPSHGESAAQLIARLDAPALAALLVAHADEPYAVIIAGLLTSQPCDTTHAAERIIRMGLNAARPDLPKTDVKMSVRRTFQALRIAVNDEFGALDALLQALPACLAPGGRAAIITFHSGEDRRVKKAFRAGHRAQVYSRVSASPVRSGKAETFTNRRAQAAKLRWAVRGSGP
ncbi:MAG: 16S rRNA (cytosine(1402)-N(4))-methyltransferase RsmH [Vicinamibacterales bacterium]